MAKGKKTIKIYTDWGHIISSLPDDISGKLFKQILNYCNEDGEPYPDPEDPIINALWQAFKIRLKADLKKWEKRVAINQKNGRLGGRPITCGIPEKPKKTQSVKNGFKNNPKKGDTDTDTDTDSYLTITKKEIVVVDNEKFMREIEADPDSHQQYLEAIYMQLRLKGGTLGKLMGEFVTHLASEETQKKNVSEFKKHFKNWLLSQDGRNKLTKQKLII